MHKYCVELWFELMYTNAERNLPSPFREADDWPGKEGADRWKVERQF